MNNLITLNLVKADGSNDTRLHTVEIDMVNYKFTPIDAINIVIDRTQSVNINTLLYKNNTPEWYAVENLSQIGELIYGKEKDKEIEIVIEKENEKEGEKTEEPAKSKKNKDK